MAKKTKIPEVTNTNSEVKSLFDGDKLTGKPLSEYRRPTNTEVAVVDTEQYVEELRSARQLTDHDYSIRINA